MTRLDRISGISGISRRDVLRLGGLAALSVGAQSLLAGCGTTTTKTVYVNKTVTVKVPSPSEQIAAYWAAQHPTGELDIASWPHYIDTAPNQPGVHPSIQAISEQLSIKVRYAEVIEETDPFISSIDRALTTGTFTGYDVAVITDGAAMANLIANHQLIGLDPDQLTNFWTYSDPGMRSSVYDPNNVYSVPWQSGVTGIAYDPAKTGRDIVSFNELFDPVFANRVGMFANTDDLPNATLLGMGVDPVSSTEADWRKAATRLYSQQASGVVRGYFRQEYLNALLSGELWLSQAWSGDIAQAVAAGHTNLKFVVPDEGGLLWTDNMVLLQGARNPMEAMSFIDAVYSPAAAEQIATSIDYISPVPGIRALMQQQLLSSPPATQASLQAQLSDPLEFLTGAEDVTLHGYRHLFPEEKAVWDSIFLPLYQPQNIHSARGSA
jgi:spermidine/putrescine transport system substrate-binding protein